MENNAISERDRRLLNRFGMSEEQFKKAAEAARETSNIFAPKVLKEADEKKSRFMLGWRERRKVSK